MKVLMTTGGSGGHIFPALQVALQLKGRGHEVVFAGALKMAQEKLSAQGFRTINIPAQGLTLSPIGICQFVLAMFKALVKAFKVLRQERPDKVIGFGGYGSFAVIVMAWVLRYPSMIHEQNVVPGKANQLMAHMVRKIAITFKQSSDYFSKGKTVWTGCPCHYGTVNLLRSELCQRFGLKQEGKVVLLLGGSQGAKHLNETFSKMLLAHSSSLGIQAIHMTGKGEYEKYQAFYQEHGLPVKVFPFISNIEEAYAVADVVIARSGASTVCELGLLGKAAILVPYPFAGNHQQYNAKVLSDAKAAVLLEQKDCDETSLKRSIEDLLFQQMSSQERMSQTAGLFNSHAAIDLALAVEAL